MFKMQHKNTRNYTSANSKDAELLYILSIHFYYSWF